MISTHPPDSVPKNATYKTDVKSALNLAFQLMHDIHLVSLEFQIFS